MQIIFPKYENFIWKKFVKESLKITRKTALGSMIQTKSPKNNFLRLYFGGKYKERNYRIAKTSSYPLYEPINISSQLRPHFF